MQSLIAKTEALGWDTPNQLEIHDGNTDSQEGYAFIGKLLALKTLKHLPCLSNSIYGVEFCNTSVYGGFGSK